MRWLIAISAAICLAIAGVAIFAGANRISGGTPGQPAANEDADGETGGSHGKQQRAEGAPALGASRSERQARPSFADDAQAPAQQASSGGANDANSAAIRSVAPGIIAVPDIDANALQRLEPRSPLSPIGQANLPKRKVREEGPDVFRPVAVAAGRIETDEVSITIAGIEPLEPEAQCSRDEGGQWPCGMAARTAFRSLLRGRALDCDLPSGERGDALTVACRLGTTDLGAWLVENGWARAAPDSSYAGLEAQARSGGRGIFGSGPKPLPDIAEPGPSTPGADRSGGTQTRPSVPLGNGLY